MSKTLVILTAGAVLGRVPEGIPSQGAADGSHRDASSVTAPGAVRSRLTWLHLAIRRARQERETKSPHAFATRLRGGETVYWFVEIDGSMAPEDDSARDAPAYPSAFVALVYEADGRMLGISRYSAAHAEDSYSQDDLLFDRGGRAIGSRHDYVSYVDCGASRVDRTLETVLHPETGKVVERSEIAKADGRTALPSRCVLADSVEEAPASVRAALARFKLGTMWERDPGGVGAPGR